jgi:hypothetical protein
MTCNLFDQYFKIVILHLIIKLRNTVCTLVYGYERNNFYEILCRLNWYPLDIGP